MNLFDELKDKVKKTKKTLVFPEGEDPRIIQAALRLKKEGLVEPILLGRPEKVQAQLGQAEELTIIDFKNADQKATYTQRLAQIRQGKNSREEVEAMMEEANYFGTMMVEAGQADGLVSGAVGSTGDTVRPALQIIKTKQEVSLISGAMLLVRGEERYIFSDIAINIDLNEDQLAETAIETAKTARIFGIDPKIAFLSFSTKGSAQAPASEKMRAAALKAQALAPDLVIDGELQFDAAFVPAVGQQKAPGSAVAGQANTFIFPDLNAGNIGYKIAQRMGGFQAIGPILQGMRKPISDLSRGASAEDVYHLALITALLEA